jgi:hypothetical protein
VRGSAHASGFARHLRPLVMVVHYFSSCYTSQLHRTKKPVPSRDRLIETLLVLGYNRRWFRGGTLPLCPIRILRPEAAAQQRNCTYIHANSTSLKLSNDSTPFIAVVECFIRPSKS